MSEFIDWLMSWTGQVEEWILGVADAWWVHIVVYLFAAFDGFFPSVPSESTIVTLSSLWSSSGRPSIILLGLAAWLGAWTGDNLGYLIGSKIGWERFRFLREGKGRKAVEAADHGLQHRALLFLMTARYIPFGRTAVNLVAGAVHYPHRQFWPRSLLSTFVWAVYSCAIGAVAGAWFADHHLLAITVALIAAVVMALALERLIAAVHRRLDRRAARRAAPDGSSDEAAADPGDEETAGADRVRPTDAARQRHADSASEPAAHPARAMAGDSAPRERVGAASDSPTVPDEGEDRPA